MIDPSRSEIFAVADERAANGSINDHLLGVNLGSGKVELNEVADVPGRPPNAELQRPGLTLDRGQVIIGYGGNDGDCGNYTGPNVAVPEGGGPDRVYRVEPTAGDREGAVWQGGGFAARRLVRQHLVLHGQRFGGDGRPLRLQRLRDHAPADARSRAVLRTVHVGK